VSNLSMRGILMGNLRTGALLLSCALLAPAVEAGEWTNWRGPSHDGVSPETDLVSTWSTEGENLIWRADFTGRSTAAVFDGRACAIGRDGEGILRQEVVVCWSAETGERLWQWRSTPHNTFVPWQRLGWASVAGDAETGYLFAHTSDGVLVALDRAGMAVWQWRLGEDIGRTSGYGGRTHTPIVDEDRVIVAAINTSWGDMGGPPSMRYWAFDKHTGEVLFAAKPSPRTRDANTQSTPIVAVVDGERLLIGASSDGSVYAVRARTGEKLWGFQVSKVSLNAGVATDGKRVFASHSEENIDTGTMGRMVAIDATGRGDDITASGEVWRIPDLKAGFGTPLVHGGRVYQLDNSANLYAIDAATGEVRWVQNVGTVGKSGPVWADGKIYVTEVNGKFHILRDAGDRAEMLSTVEILIPDGGRPAEIYASPAIAYGRIYFATEEGFYCLGDPTRPFTAKPSEPRDLGEAPAAPGAEPALIHVVPAEVATTTGERLSFRVRAFDNAGHFLGELPATSWSLDGLAGKVSANGEVTLEDTNGLAIGYVVAKLGELEGRARVRAAGSLPWQEDFEQLPTGDFPKGGFPAGWLGRGKKAHVEEIDGNNVLVQPDPKFFAPRAVIYAGPSLMSGYTIQADIYATAKGRRKPELGLINSGYTFLVAGIQQRLEIRSWGSELRMMQRREFAWDMNTWYTMKLRVDIESDGEGRERAAVRGKVWKRAEAEPGDWTFTVHDPLPITNGAPGLYGFTPVDGYFDNVKITKSE
jgi:outer membrane protein assembly factor BamB